MLIDTDVLFDELEGYAFYHKCEVKAVINDKVKCEDGEVLEFYEDIEYIIDEFDEILILKRVHTLQDLERFKSHMNESADANLLTTLEEHIEIARKDGAYETFACIHNDSFYDLHSFSF